MWLKTLLSLFAYAVKYMENKQLLDAGEIRQMKEIQDKVLKRVKIKIHNKLNIDDIDDSILLFPDKRDDDK